MEVEVCDWEAGRFSFLQSLGMSGYSQRAGLGPLTTLKTIKGQGWRISSSSLSPLSLALPPSLNPFLFFFSLALIHSH